LLQAGRMMTLVFSGSMEVITPNSIASVKGTRWWTIIESPMETKIVVLEGEVSVKNLASQAEQIVQVGQTAVSKSDGVIEISATKADEVPSEPTEQQGSSLEIEFQSDSGQTKTVRIEY